MVLVQKWPFFQLFFLSNIDQENVFYNILEHKMPVQAIKTRRSKSRKFDIFLKGLTHGLGPKMAFFPTFFFLKQYKPGKFLYDIVERKNAFLGYKNKKFKQIKNSHFSKVVNPWFWSKNGLFSNFVLLGKIYQQNVFYDILERKNAFLRQ